MFAILISGPLDLKLFQLLYSFRHEGSPEIMNPTRDSDPLVTMRVARSLAELPALVPGLVSPSHWLQFNHPLPYDNSLALLLVQDDIRSLPEAWAYAMGACFDMLWVTSLAAKDELVQARVPPNRVQVLLRYLSD